MAENQNHRAMQLEQKYLLNLISFHSLLKQGKLQWWRVGLPHSISSHTILAMPCTHLCIDSFLS